MLTSKKKNGAVEMTKAMRHVELDIVKGFGICFMVLVHVMIQFYPYWTGNVVFSRTILALGRFPAAPCFMFCLGAGIVMSRKSTPSALFCRGLRMLAIGYLIVNLLVYAIPNAIYIYIYPGIR